MSSTKQLMQGRSNTGWSIRDSSCRNCHHYDRVGTYLCPHHRIGHNLECGSCNIRLGTQHLPAIHVRVLRDNWTYRAANGRTQAVDTAAFVGLAPPAKTSQETVANTHASRECPCLPLTGSPTAAARSVTNRLASDAMASIPLHWNGMDNRVIQWIAIRWTQVDGHDPELANWRP